MRFACLLLCALVAIQLAGPVRAWDQRARNCLDIHNKYRQMHGVPSLQWDENLANFAQGRSQHMASNSLFQHEPDTPHGENLAMHSDQNTDCAALVKLWYDEIAQYSKRLGCGMANGSRGVILTCNYSPPGNVQGAFEGNVPSRTREGAELSEPAVSTSNGNTGRGSGSINIEHSGHESASSIMERLKKQMEDQMRAHEQFVRDNMPSFASSSSSSSSRTSSSSWRSESSAK